VVPSDDHECAWKAHALELKKQLDDVAEKQRVQQEQLEALQKKRLSGTFSGRMKCASRQTRPSSGWGTAAMARA
jgi:hypothetical protein